MSGHDFFAILVFHTRTNSIATADALCSLSKIFFDLGLLCSLVCSYPHNLPTSSTVLLIPSLFASMPFLIRIRQCMGSYFNNEKNDGFEFMHILNR